MGRALLVINGPFDRKKAADWCLKAPAGTRIEFKAAKRAPCLKTTGCGPCSRTLRSS